MKTLLILFALFPFNAIAKPVNVNSADAKTLAASLQGIGPEKAEAIVQYRDTYGLFETLDDLTNVGGIGDKTVEKNATDILLVDPETTNKP